MKTYEAFYEPEKNKGVYGISLVENPAMEGLFIALSKDEVIQFKEVDKEQRILTGLALEPNKPIYRNQNGEEFNIVFSESTIKDLAFGFLKNGYQKNSSLEHDSEITGVTFTESWIIEDSKNDKANALGFSYPKGSWMVTMKVDDPKVWEDYVKTGKVQGFSIDAMLSLKEVKLAKNQKIDGTPITFSMLTRGSEVWYMDGNVLENGTHELMTNVEIDVVNGIVTDIREVNLKTEIKMSTEKQNSIIEMLANLPDRIMLALKGEPKTEEVKLGEIKSADGNVTIMFDGEAPEVGGKVWVMADDDTEVPLPVGDYELEDKRILVVAEVGVIAEIKEATTEEEPAATESKPAEMTATETDATARAIENAIKSIMIKYSEDNNKVVDELKAELKETKEKLIELSNQPAAKPIKSVPTQSEPKNARERILQTINEQN